MIFTIIVIPNKNETGRLGWTVVKPNFYDLMGSSNFNGNYYNTPPRPLGTKEFLRRNIIISTYIEKFKKQSQ